MANWLAGTIARLTKIAKKVVVFRCTKGETVRGNDFGLGIVLGRPIQARRS